MRSTVNLKGDLEKYILEESKKSGMTVPNVLVSLAVAGMEYKQALKSFSTLASALDGVKDKNGVILKDEKGKFKV